MNTTNTNHTNHNTENNTRWGVLEPEGQHGLEVLAVEVEEDERGDQPRPPRRICMYIYIYIYIYVISTLNK